jgi:hypothetical protein
MTREQWLLRALALVSAHLYATSQSVVPDAVRVSCGFPGGRGSGLKAIGQCWPTELSADQTTEIFISPTIADPVEVLAILVHEAVHAAVGCKHGHKAPFKRVAVAAGLEGKMTSTHASDALKVTLTGWLESLGDYPHASLSMSGRKKQSTRLVKCTCSSCGYIARTTQKWIDASGAPLCNCQSEDDHIYTQMTIEGQEDDDE